MNAYVFLGGFYEYGVAVVIANNEDEAWKIFIEKKKSNLNMPDDSDDDSLFFEATARYRLAQIKELAEPCILAEYWE